MCTRNLLLRRVVRNYLLHLRPVVFHIDYKLKASLVCIVGIANAQVYQNVLRFRALIS